MAIDFGNPDLQDLMRRLQMAGLSGAQAGYIAGIPVEQRAQAFNIYADQMVPQIGAMDLAQFDSQRSRMRDALARGQARLDFEQGNADQDYATGRANLTRQFDQMRERLPYGFGRRGLANSGVYKQGLQDYGDQRLRAFGDFEQRRQRQQGAFGLQRNEIAGAYRSGMGDVDQLEKARRAQIAAQIKAAQ